MKYEDDLASTDRKIRAEALTNILNEHSLPDEEKKKFLLKGLKDDHDFVRSRAIECLTKTNFKEIPEIFLSHIATEPYWGVRYLILKNLFDNKERWHIEQFTSQIIALTKDPKPQIRIITAQILAELEQWSSVTEMFNDKDEIVRKEVRSLLEKSNDPSVRTKMEEYQRLLAEKEAKKRKMTAMFDGI